MFAVGDKVRCVDAKESLLTRGWVYVVSDVPDEYGVRVHGTTDPDYRYLNARFELVLPASKREAAEQHAVAGIGPEATDYHSRKFDKGKSRPDLIPGEALEGIGDVLAYGAAKYAEDSWQQVPDAEKRYLAAQFRHLIEIRKHGLRSVDPESGKLHIDHVATNAAFLQYFARKAP